MPDLIFLIADSRVVHQAQEAEKVIRKQRLSLKAIVLDHILPSVVCVQKYGVAVQVVKEGPKRGAILKCARNNSSRLAVRRMAVLRLEQRFPTIVSVLQLNRSGSAFVSCCEGKYRAGTNTCGRSEQDVGSVRGEASNSFTKYL